MTCQQRIKGLKKSLDGNDFDGPYYYSTLIPRQNDLVEEFIKGCSKRRSCFIGIERKCKCVILASIPEEKDLNGFCLMEILVDKNNGGNFIGCRSMVDQLFKVLKVTSCVTLNRMSYILQTSFSENKLKHQNFFSTLSRLYNVRHVCEILQKNASGERTSAERVSKEEEFLFRYTPNHPEVREAHLNMRKMNGYGDFDYLKNTSIVFERGFEMPVATLRTKVEGSHIGDVYVSLVIIPSETEGRLTTTGVISMTARSMEDKDALVPIKTTSEDTISRVKEHSTDKMDLSDTRFEGVNVVILDDVIMNTVSSFVQLSYFPPETVEGTLMTVLGDLNQKSQSIRPQIVKIREMNIPRNIPCPKVTACFIQSKKQKGPFQSKLFRPSMSVISEENKTFSSYEVVNLGDYYFVEMLGIITLDGSIDENNSVLFFGDICREEAICLMSHGYEAGTRDLSSKSILKVAELNIQSWSHATTLEDEVHMEEDLNSNSGNNERIFGFHSEQLRQVNYHSETFELVIYNSEGICLQELFKEKVACLSNIDICIMTTLLEAAFPSELIRRTLNLEVETLVYSNIKRLVTKMSSTPCYENEAFAVWKLYSQEHTNDFKDVRMKALPSIFDLALDEKCQPFSFSNKESRIAGDYCDLNTVTVESRGIPTEYVDEFIAPSFEVTGSGYLDFDIVWVLTDQIIESVLRELLDPEQIPKIEEKPFYERPLPIKQSLEKDRNSLQMVTIDKMNLPSGDSLVAEINVFDDSIEIPFTKAEINDMEERKMLRKERVCGNEKCTLLKKKKKCAYRKTTLLKKEKEIYKDFKGSILDKIVTERFMKCFNGDVQRIPHRVRLKKSISDRPSSQFISCKLFVEDKAAKEDKEERNMASNVHSCKGFKHEIGKIKIRRKIAENRLPIKKKKFTKEIEGGRGQSRGSNVIFLGKNNEDRKHLVCDVVTNQAEENYLMNKAAYLPLDNLSKRWMVYDTRPRMQQLESRRELLKKDCKEDSGQPLVNIQNKIRNLMDIRNQSNENRTEIKSSVVDCVVQIPIKRFKPIHEDTLGDTHLIFDFDKTDAGGFIKFDLFSSLEVTKAQRRNSENDEKSLKRKNVSDIIIVENENSSKIETLNSNTLLVSRSAAPSNDETLIYMAIEGNLKKKEKKSLKPSKLLLTDSFPRDTKTHLSSDDGTSAEISKMFDESSMEPCTVIVEVDPLPHRVNPTNKRKKRNKSRGNVDEIVTGRDIGKRLQLSLSNSFQENFLSKKCFSQKDIRDIKQVSDEIRRKHKIVNKGSASPQGRCEDPFADGWISCLDGVLKQFILSSKFTP